MFRNSQHSVLRPNAITLEWKVDLSDFERGMAAANQTGGSEYFANCWCTGILHVQSSLGFAKKQNKKKSQGRFSEWEQSACLSIAGRRARVSRGETIWTPYVDPWGQQKMPGWAFFTFVSSEQETDKFCRDWWFTSPAETGGVANWHKQHHAMDQSICASVASRCCWWCNDVGEVLFV